MARAGVPKTAEHREKLAAANRGKKISDETKAKMSAAQKGRIVSEETRAKMRAASLGKPKSEAARAAMSAAKTGKPGRKLSEAEKANLSALRSGRPLSEEHRAKLSAAKLGKPGPWSGKKRGPLSPEWKSAIAEGNRGKKISEEHRLKISGRNSERWGKPPHHGKRIEYAGIVFRSSYEVRFAQALEKQGIPWLYEPTVFDLGTCTYRPDFYLPTMDAYWEVKGWLGPDSQRKTRLFREIHPEIPLIVATKPILELMRF